LIQPIKSLLKSLEYEDVLYFSKAILSGLEASRPPRPPCLEACYEALEGLTRPLRDL